MSFKTWWGRLLFTALVYVTNPFIKLYLLLRNVRKDVKS